MIVTGKTKFKTDLFSFAIAKNPPKVVVTGDIPEEYTKTVVSTDTAKIKEDLKDGIWLEFAELVQTESLRIK